jgi:hypothetical protein
MRVTTCTAIAAAMMLTLSACNTQEAGTENEASASTEAASLDGLSGTWAADLTSVKWEGKPDEFTIKDGTYSCATCIPPLTTPADGQFHAVADRPYFDSMSVKVVDARTVDFQRRKGDKEIGRTNWQVSEDGNTLTVNWVDKTTTPAAEGTTTLKRAGPAPAGAHAVSGQWKPEQVQTMTADAAKVTFTITGNTVKMNRLSESYTAELGGPAVPIEGDAGGTTVAVAREGTNGLRETFTRGGKEVSIITTVPSADGKSATITDTDPRDGSKATWTANKEG